MSNLKITDIIDHLESFAPPSYQESYDNSGLITGYLSTEVTGILITLDCIEHVVQEAIDRNCNLIIAHHPIVFKGLKKLNGSNYVERTVIAAIKNDIAIVTILDECGSQNIKLMCAHQRIGQISAPVLDALANC